MNNGNGATAAAVQAATKADELARRERDRQLERCDAVAQKIARAQQAHTAAMADIEEAGLVLADDPTNQPARRKVAQASEERDAAEAACTALLVRQEQERATLAGLETKVQQTSANLSAAIEQQKLEQLRRAEATLEKRYNEAAMAATLAERDYLQAKDARFQHEQRLRESAWRATQQQVKRLPSPDADGRTRVTTSIGV